MSAWNPSVKTVLEGFVQVPCKCGSEGIVFECFGHVYPYPNDPVHLYYTGMRVTCTLTNKQTAAKERKKKKQTSELVLTDESRKEKHMIYCTYV